jgi:hypothetical protein
MLTKQACLNKVFTYLPTHLWLSFLTILLNKSLYLSHLSPSLESLVSASASVPYNWGLERSHALLVSESFRFHSTNMMACYYERPDPEKQFLHPAHGQQVNYNLKYMRMILTCYRIYIMTCNINWTRWITTVVGCTGRGSWTWDRLTEAKNNDDAWGNRALNND